MYLKEDVLERIALLSSNTKSQTFVKVVLENKDLVITMKDSRDYFFTNNFQTKITYNGADDERRFYHINISLENGDMSGDTVQTSIFQTHSFETYKKANNEDVDNSVKEHLKVLKKEIKKL